MEAGGAAGRQWQLPRTRQAGGERRQSGLDRSARGVPRSGAAARATKRPHRSGARGEEEELSRGAILRAAIVPGIRTLVDLSSALPRTVPTTAEAAAGLAVGAGPQTMGRRDHQRAETIRWQQLLKLADGARQPGQAAAMALEAQLPDAGDTDMHGAPRVGPQTRHGVGEALRFEPPPQQAVAVQQVAVHSASAGEFTSGPSGSAS